LHEILVQMALKEKIIEVSLQQFLTHGIRKMTVLKLAEPLNLSTKTVYKYFRDKEDLLKHCLLVHYSELSAKFRVFEAESSNPVTGIYKIWHEAIKLDFGVSQTFYYDLNYYYPELQDSVMQEVFRSIPKDLTKLIEKGIRESYFIDGIEPAIVIKVMELLYTGITRTDRFKGSRMAPVVILHNTIDLYLRGLCTEKGLKELNHSYSNIIKNAP
jgi:AcrR family transcriptional regulator